MNSPCRPWCQPTPGLLRHGSKIGARLPNDGGRQASLFPLSAPMSSGPGKWYDFCTYKSEDPCLAWWVAFWGRVAWVPCPLGSKNAEEKKTNSVASPYAGNADPCHECMAWPRKFASLRLGRNLVECVKDVPSTHTHIHTGLGTSASQHK
jgi:hypothetical protein